MPCSSNCFHNLCWLLSYWHISRRSIDIRTIRQNVSLCINRHNGDLYVSPKSVDLGGVYCIWNPKSLPDVKVPCISTRGHVAHGATCWAVAIIARTNVQAVAFGSASDMLRRLWELSIETPGLPRQQHFCFIWVLNTGSIVAVMLFIQLNW